MGQTQVSLRSLAAGAVLTVVLAGCGGGGDLSFRNDGPDDVGVVSDGEVSSIEADGGMVILDAGCTDGDVLVTFPSGETVTLAGPVCPDQEVVIHDQQVDLRPRTDGQVDHAVIPRYGRWDGHRRHTEFMAILATIRRWNTHRAWGVLDSPETPGGCWAHLSSIAKPGPWNVQPGDECMLEWEHAQQDGFAYRAVRMWPVGTAPIDPVVRHNSSAYRSSLTLTFDEG